MKTRDLINLLNNAAAVLECGTDMVSDRERADLVDALLSAAIDADQPDQPEEADLPHREWKCEECGAINSCLDADCQFCDGKIKEEED